MAIMSNISTFIILFTFFWLTFSTYTPPILGNVTGPGIATRYWDCCKPSCAWKARFLTQFPVSICNEADIHTWSQVQQERQNSSCDGGRAYACSATVPWAVNETFSYGFAAANLKVRNHAFPNATSPGKEACCACFRLKFTSGLVEGKEMIVQIINSGSDLRTNGPVQFDIATPGGGVGKFPQGCQREFGNDTFLGNQYGGYDSREHCDNLPDGGHHVIGCQWRFDWFKNVDHQPLNYTQVACPEALTNMSGCKRCDEMVLPPPIDQEYGDQEELGYCE